MLGSVGRLGLGRVAAAGSVGEIDRLVRRVKWRQLNRRFKIGWLLQISWCPVLPAC